ncbi:hypothetical protein HYFRA_00013963 [Hymenoscyphus fraxineus]|uniref:Uncharacterized protein n=1 Tax=Hymenoscyphus fraxineus TaxID=746836 RepID=A0A9N9LC71_9HELO|nr:hypothetical protein HYFRA_00013963 [Hymenoscyphus fraxineus]
MNPSKRLEYYWQKCALFTSSPGYVQHEYLAPYTKNALKTQVVLLCTFTTQVVSSIVQMFVYSDGSYAWTGFIPDTVTPSKNVMWDNVLKAWKDMDTQAYTNGYDRPSTMAVLYARGEGYIYHSSIKGAGSTTSQGTIAIMDNACPHWYNGNCAEMGAIAMAEGDPYNFDLTGAQGGSYVTVYGVGPQSHGRPSYLEPCQPNGRGEYVRKFEIVPIKKRDERVFGQENYGIVGHSIRRSLLVV